MADAQREPDAAAGPEPKCHRCARPLAMGTRVCPGCGHKQYRQCFCGQAFPSNLGQCPACGTDWTGAARLRRRSRSGKIKRHVLWRSAGTGAIIAVLGAGLLNVFVNGLAKLATPSGIVPGSMAQRLHYAWYSLYKIGSDLVNKVVGAGLPYLLVIALIGAAIGILWYVLPIRVGRWTRSSRHRHDRVRRRRRGVY